MAEVMEGQRGSPFSSHRLQSHRDSNKPLLDFVTIPRADLVTRLFVIKDRGNQKARVRPSTPAPR